ncbi:MAG: LamG domain-containing protein, partial [Bacteroidia bacterium]|nr:LamG domain-containing protein [Bacteroidia bacterium]
MKKLLHFIFLLSFLGVAQPSSEGMYFDGIDDFFDVPGTSNINSTTTNNRTYETYFKVTNTTPRQVIMEEGGGTRAVIFYVENGYLVVGAYNRTDYNPRWQGTFYRKAISANTWYHFALVFDNAQPANATTNPMTTTANNALKWYLDGVLQDQISGYQFGPHNPTVLGFKDGTLRFPNCGGTWTTSGLSEYCFNSNVNDNGSGEYYFQGNLWGYRMWSDVRTPTEIVDNMDNIITTIGTDNLVAALDGDTFTYLDNNNDPVDLSNPNPPTPITWSATAGSSDWNTGSNWVGGVAPNAGRLEDAIIQTSTNYPIIASHIIAGDVTVQAGAEITINDGGTLDVSYDIINNGTITVNLFNADTNGGGALITREAKAVSGTGTFLINRQTPDYPEDYYSIWSTPVSQSDSKINTIFTNPVIVYEYDASQNPSAYVGVSTSHDMDLGEGYFIRLDSQSGGMTRTFDGTVNNGDITRSIYYNGPTDNFNLLGNPYPSALNWVKFYDDNADVIEGTMYYWNQSQVGPNNSASDYISYNRTGSSEPGTSGDIATGLGVFVKSIQPGSVTFKNTHRVVGSNDQFFRSSENPDDGKSWFR